jgi:hypothetical protein
VESVRQNRPGGVFRHPSARHNAHADDVVAHSRDFRARGTILYGDSVIKRGETGYVVEDNNIPFHRLISTKSRTAGDKAKKKRSA